eukprot:7141789-Lingulodinium_polyedra.AAC.1
MAGEFGIGNSTVSTRRRSDAIEQAAATAQTTANVEPTSRSLVVASGGNDAAIAQAGAAGPTAMNVRGGAEGEATSATNTGRSQSHRI